MQGAYNLIKRDRPVIWLECLDKDSLKEINDYLLSLGYKNMPYDESNYIFSLRAD